MYKVLLPVAAVGAIVAVALAPAVTNAVTGPADGTGTQQMRGNGNGAGRSAVLESQAKLLGISVDELNKLRAEGKTLYEIAESKGISLDAFKQKMTEASRARWESRGLSAEQITERQKMQAERQAECDGTGDHQYQGQGFGRQGMNR